MLRRVLMFKQGLFGLAMSPLILLVALYACSTPQTADILEKEPTTVEIDEKMHFRTPSEEDVAVLPGAYEVKPEKFGIRLIAEEGTGDESLLIEARAIDHQELITNPTALLVSDKKDDRVLTLLLPNGKGWEAWGTQNGIHSRTTQRPPLPSTLIKRYLKSEERDMLVVPQLSLSTVSIKYPGSKKSYKGEKLRTTWRLPVNDTLNAGTLTFTWAGYWDKSALKPSFIPSKVVDFQNLVNKKQCCIKLTINGKEVKLSRLKFGQRGTLLTRVKLSYVRAITWPKTVKVIVTKGKKTWESATTKMYAKTMSYYETELHPIFSHERCTTCHSLGDNEKILEMHQYRLGIENYPYKYDEEARPQNPTFCVTCHNAPNLQKKWASPLAAQGIDWKGWDPGSVCRKVTGPFTNIDGKVEPPFDHDKFDDHFHNDPLLLWAVSDGGTPLGKELEVPLRNNLNAWFRKVDPWVDAGTPCPIESNYFLRDGSATQEKFFPRR